MTWVGKGLCGFLLEGQADAQRPRLQPAAEPKDASSGRTPVSGKMFLPEYGRDVLLSHGNDVFHLNGNDVFSDYGKQFFQ